jgi:hypothetical protein
MKWPEGKISSKNSKELEESGGVEHRWASKDVEHRLLNVSLVDWYSETVDRK